MLLYPSKVGCFGFNHYLSCGVCVDIIHENLLINQEKLQSLNDFLALWVENYLNEISMIPMFDTEKTKYWTSAQKIFFAKTFYHVRGHFYKFLWFLGNFAPDYKAKLMILDNIAEEFSKGKSHEQLYIDFANSIGADLTKEIVHEESHLLCIQQFNKGHLEWLSQHDWESRLAAFSAYEKLDNVDYDKLLKLAISINTSKEGQVFFVVHNNAKHFEKTEEDLLRVWSSSPKKVEEAFLFILKYQIDMWKNLSKSIFECR